VALKCCNLDCFETLSVILQDVKTHAVSSSKYDLRKSALIILA
jgi:hypothetical protein